MISTVKNIKTKGTHAVHLKGFGSPMCVRPMIICREQKYPNHHSSLESRDESDNASKVFLAAINLINDRIIAIRSEISRLERQNFERQKKNADVTRIIDVEIDDMYTSLADMKEKIHQRDLIEMYCDAFPQEPECKIYDI